MTTTTNARPAHRRRVPIGRFLLLIVLLLAVTACSAPAAPTTGSTAASAAEPANVTTGEPELAEVQELTAGISRNLVNGEEDWIYAHASLQVWEPLIRYDDQLQPYPGLAEKWTLSDDGLTWTFELRKDVNFSDGEPFNAEAAVAAIKRFAVVSGRPSIFLGGINFPEIYGEPTAIEVVDEFSFRIVYATPRPLLPYSIANHYSAMLSPKVFAENGDIIGLPIGTGPYKVKEFKPGDVVVYDINENYRVADQPHFSEVIFKGGGDAPSAARAALETGEVDYAWNLQVEPAILNEMAAKGLGTLVSSYTGNVERILINFTNPAADLGDQRSEWLEGNPNAHPSLSDIAVRQALSMAINRSIIAEQLYGAAGKPTCNILSGPPAVVSTNNDACLTQDIEGAKALLEGAGWVDSNGDGIREKDGVELRYLYQTSTNAVRQKAQALIKQWWTEIGVEAELKNTDAGVFFGGDPASPDTLGKFFADVQMFTNGPDNPDPQSYLSGWLCMSEGKLNIANSSNQWLGNNTERWCSPEFDAKFDELKASTDPAERVKLSIELNDMLAQNYVNLPLIFRSSVSAHANSLVGVELGWDSEQWNIETWHRQR